MRTDLQGRAYIATDPQAPLATLTGLAIPEHDTIELGRCVACLSCILPGRLRPAASARGPLLCPEI